MMTQELIEILTEYIDDEAVDVNSITRDTHLINDLKIDSAYLIEIILDIETKYDISVSDDMLSRISTIASVEEIIKELQPQ